MTRLTRRACTATQTTLWVESAPGAGDYHPLDVDVGQIGCFHGTLCRHYAPANASPCTRVSLDFRVGVGRWFYPAWQKPGVKAQHTRREARVRYRRARAAAEQQQQAADRPEAAA